MYIDADDYIHPYTLEWSVTVAEKFDVDLVQFGYKRVSENSNRKDDIRLQEIKLQLVEGNIEIEELSDDIASAKLYRTDKIKSLGLKFKHRIYEDTAFTRKYALASEKAVFTDYPLYYYYINPVSLTSNISSKKIESFIERTDEILEIYTDYGLSIKANKYLHNSKKFILRQLWKKRICGTEKIQVSSASITGNIYAL